MPDLAADELIRRTLAGERVPLARALSWVENEHPHASALLDACFGRTGRAFRLGVTGPPGAGKSTLVTQLAKEYRARGETVAVVAVDPTSPFSGGALLGDRVRMHELSGDDGVFIRSMATRGSMGGLAVHTAQACDVLDAAGFDRILIETVGVGQSELEVAQTADSTAVVLVPESGDAVQAMKAGLMEIADLFVINKSDREGADRAAQAIRSALHLRARTSEWTIPVMLTAASLGRGVPELVQAFERHLEWLTETGTLAGRRRQRLEQTLEVLVRERLWEDFRSQVPEGAWREALATLAERRETPNRLSERLVRGTHRSAATGGPRQPQAAKNPAD
ncbi:MAG TPA: methylmalonyl Co-A mutase-associated GTPase MeaB [Methylomirabilota bacterium]|jgi:LAO/AO transport system kinase|nr:methylmalonyl Co-A mutase-associated GTPase MeaB [Methylomirabilota bacterium]